MRRHQTGAVHARTHRRRRIIFEQLLGWVCWGAHAPTLAAGSCFGATAFALTRALFGGPIGVTQLGRFLLKVWLKTPMVSFSLRACSWEGRGGEGIRLTSRTYLDILYLCAGRFAGAGSLPHRRRVAVGGLSLLVVGAMQKNRGLPLWVTGTQVCTQLPAWQTSVQSWLHTPYIAGLFRYSGVIFFFFRV